MNVRTTFILAALFIASISFHAQHIASGSYHCYSLCNDGTVMSWGNDGSGELGNGANSSMNHPVAVNTLTNITNIATGSGSHGLALQDNGNVWAWGSNDAGQLGDGSVISSNVPILLSTISDVKFISRAYYHSMAVKNDGSLWVWGSNSQGQLGDGTLEYHPVPTEVTSLPNLLQAAGGMGHTIALLEDGTVWAWGTNLYGELGNGTTTDSYTPVQVTGLTDIVAIASGRDHGLALKNDGTVWSWGVNLWGELGNGNSTVTTSPVQFGTLNNVVAIAAGQYQSLALLDDGTVWGCGNNNYGALGTGTQNDSFNTPVQVVGLTDAIAVAAGDFHSLALKSDGTVRTWGFNETGAVGNDTFITSNLPVQPEGLCEVMTGENEISRSNSISIYPNPAHHQITILSDDALVSIRILSITGSEVFTVPVMADKHKSTISMHDLSSGMYAVQLKTTKGESVTKILIE